MVDIGNLYHDKVEEEISLLNNAGHYVASYHKCELILINWSNGIEWFDDNKWYKEEIEDVTNSLEELNLYEKSKGKEKEESGDKRKKPTFRLMDLFSIAAFYTGNYYRAFYLQYRVLNSSFTDKPSDMMRLKFNINFSIEKIRHRLDFYPEDVVEIINDPRRTKKGLVTLSMTTCKRFYLFQRTMNSFLNACKDIDLVDRFLIIDDNSSDEDCEKMKKLYPFIELVRKKLEDKGHPVSMNMIRDMVKTPYCLHLEDDHEFFCHRNYIRPSLRIMLENSYIKQVLFNENYSEIPSDLTKIGGGEIKKTKNGKKFLEHVYYPMGTPEYDKYLKSLNRPSNTHWPHFSFRPSLFSTDIWKQVGDYRMEQEFERNFGRRYADLNFKSAFLIGMHHIHIGRTSHDLKEGKEVENAYILNNTRQWGY